ncbi:MAG TPA: TraR/DksA C4-type zinc finger protein [Aggregicoccus sp.]|nr:TraR/DksA C4-type zinc finger protein [Aggregicoccus sp.]
MITDTHADPIALQARQMLLRRRDTLRTLLRDNGAHASALQAERAAPEWVDRAVALEENQVLTRLEQREEHELEEVELALTRIEQGRFGTCEACGGAIGRQRLLAVPEARHCLGCGSAQAPRRPHP